MSKVNGKPAEDWITENCPTNGLFRVYWKDVVNWYEGGLTFDPEEGEGLRWEWYYKGGVRADGESKGWFPSGQMKQLAVWKDTKKIKCIEYWLNGHKMVEEYWNLDGEKDGKWFRYYESGDKQYEKSYKNGISDGNWIYWDGALKMSGVTYKDGIIWDTDSDKPYTGKWRGYTYKNGIRDGLVTSSYDSGEMRSEGTYKNGKLEGLTTFWYENGQKQDESIYKNGVEIKRVDWYENGQKRRERTHNEDDKKDGLQAWWFENGQKAYEGTFKNGKLISDKHWDKNGKVLEEL